MFNPFNKCEYCGKNLIIGGSNIYSCHSCKVIFTNTLKVFNIDINPIRAVYVYSSEIEIHILDNFLKISSFDVSILNPNNIYDTCLRLLKMKAYL